MEGCEVNRALTKKGNIYKYSLLRNDLADEDLETVSWVCQYWE